GHGWPVAAAYAADRANRWLAGAVAGLVIGTGHLVSSLAVVGLFFLLKRQFAVGAVTEPLRVAGWTVGSPLGLVAGVLLIALGVREYRGGHGHAHGGHDHSHGGETDDDHSHDHNGHSHDHGDDDHSHNHDDGHSHDHPHDDHSHGDLSATDGLWGITVSAFVLGFAHEEEFEIIAICAGTDSCLPAMTAYALTVIGVITLATLALVAGFERFEDRVTRAADYFPTLSAAVLVLLGIGFLFGIL
ncbi:MAG: hypothetical protein ABEI99_08355, partial [Halobaculum sp.]